jgi:beta-galactosidase
VGYAMPKSMQELDAEILKKDLGVHLVRTSHYPQSKWFLDACDRLGLLVFEEIPGWQHIGDEQFKEISKYNLKRMIKRDRNHPSIILWGVRINESRDDTTFYSEMNKIAHLYDETRPTGGVRNFQKSELLEDVYTYNDFIHNGQNRGLSDPTEVLPRKAPYLVTEFNGHMFPTKTSDPEDRRVSHALRHSKVLSEMMESTKISGAIGWCMTDYNTHGDFGSGDRICHHGVLNMFRQKKLAAYVYSSRKRMSRFSWFPPP